jgi:FMN phosphatase YigB (HAD superfamily)
LTVEAVLFDYHDTLFRFEGDAAWLRAGADACRMAITDSELRALALRIDEARRLPEVVAMDSERDLSQAAHRRATTEWLRLAGLPGPLADALYERLMSPACWQPFTDTEPVIRRLCQAGIAVGVLSNTGWNLRETFAHYGLRHYVAAFTLSCEVGDATPCGGPADGRADIIPPKRRPTAEPGTAGGYSRGDRPSTRG